MKRTVLLAATLSMVLPDAGFAAGNGDDDSRVNTRKACHWSNFESRLHAHNPTIRGCFDKHLENASASAKFTIKWSKRTKDNLAETKIDNEDAPSDIVECVNQKIANIPLRSTPETTCSASIQLDYTNDNDGGSLDVALLSKSPEPTTVNSALADESLGNQGELKALFDKQNESDGDAQTKDSPNKDEVRVIHLPIEAEYFHGSETCHVSQMLDEIEQRSSAFEYCYERELEQNPDLAGEMTVRWNLTVKGEVMKVETEDHSLGSKEVQSCVARVMARLQFEPPEKTCRASYRLKFDFESALRDKKPKK